MIKYTFYCGLRDKEGTPVNVRVYRAILDKKISGYTEIPCTGVWKGAREESVKFEIMAGDDSEINPHVLAAHLTASGHQDSVMWTRQVTEVHLS